MVGNPLEGAFTRSLCGFSHSGEGQSMRVSDAQVSLVYLRVLCG